MTKIYEISGKDRCQIIVYYCHVKIVAEFRQVSGGLRRSQLVTGDRFVQDALEHDPRYGKLYRCVRQYDETKTNQVIEAREEIRRTPPKLINTVKNLNEAVSWFMKKGETPDSDDDVKALMEKYNVDFPKWTRAAKEEPGEA